ncbi:hypothetical protein ACS0TY_027569 [Phlomoides rotata]
MLSENVVILNVNIFAIFHTNYLRSLFVNKKEKHVICEHVNYSVEDFVAKWKPVKAKKESRVIKFKFLIPPDKCHTQLAADVINLHYLHPQLRQVYLQLFKFFMTFIV